MRDLRRLLGRGDRRAEQRASAKLVITADGGWRRGKQLPLKENVDVALAKVADSPKVRRAPPHGQRRDDAAGRDFWWHELMAEA